jgi:hypothetical protein
MYHVVAAQAHVAASAATAETFIALADIGPAADAA